MANSYAPKFFYPLILVSFHISCFCNCEEPPASILACSLGCKQFLFSQISWTCSLENSFAILWWKAIILRPSCMSSSKESVPCCWSYLFCIVDIYWAHNVWKCSRPTSIYLWLLFHCFVTVSNWLTVVIILHRIAVCVINIVYFTREQHFQQCMRCGVNGLHLRNDRCLQVSHMQVSSL